jgi:hypothetical protein
MSPTALNLAAIGVFTMTFSALLSPIFNISPLLPAAATFTVLGLFTFDSFSLEGQGGTLIIDWFARLSPEHRSRVVRHEAGHFLVATLLDIPVTGYALNAWQAFRQGQRAQGGVRFEDRQLAEALETGKISAQLFDRYCILWMAGIAAESLTGDRIEGGNDDRQKLRAILAQNRRDLTEVQLKERWATLQAKTLIEANWEAYERLVSAMERGATVEECYQEIA